jgi:hypothetical protein
MSQTSFAEIGKFGRKNMIKKILGILGGLILLAVIALAVLTFTTPSDFKVERETTINKPRADDLAYAKILKNQNEWGPWVKQDPNIKLNYKGTDGEVGFVSAWESENENVGVGEQEIKKITDNRIDTELRFKKPMEATNQAFMILEEVSPTQTKVKWGFSGSMPKPMNLLLLVMDMEAAVGKDFESGLANLKAILEK